MAVLKLRLAGPMQAWGESSRYTQRGTRREPTFSGVIGMVAAAQGRRRSEPLEDLTQLRFGVRTDQVGRIERDFHTARREGAKYSSLTKRDYLTDACFLAILEGDANLLEGIASALCKPQFPVFLGRRSCPPEGALVLGLSDESLTDALAETPWQAAGWYTKKQPQQVHLATVRDVQPGESVDETIADIPESFTPGARQHRWRGVVHGWVEFDNPEGRTNTSTHDPFALLGGE